MKKGMWAVSALAVLAAGAVGASVYGDKKIKELYSPNAQWAQSEKRIALSEATVDMGLTGGSGRWKADYTPDLCSPDMKITLRGEDTISRGLSGYTVSSKIYLLPEGGKEIFLADSEAKFGWGGDADLTFTVPEGSHDVSNEAQPAKISWKGAQFQAALRLRDYQGQSRYFAERYQGKVDSIVLDAGGSYTFRMEKLDYRSGIPFQAGLIKSGKEEMSLDLMHFNFGEGKQMELRQLKSVSDLDAGGDKVGNRSQFEAASLQVAGKTYQNIRFNADIKDLDKGALQQFADLLARQSQSCVNEAEIMESMQKVGEAALQKGVTLESTGSQVELDGSKATFEGSLNVPANTHSLDELPAKLPEIVKYQMKLAADKAFLEKSGLMALFAPEGGALTDEALSEMGKGLPPPLKLAIEADKVVLSAQQQ